jgi:hypothetical protein
MTTSILQKLQQFTSIVPLAQTCHEMHRRRLTTLCMLGHFLGVRWHPSTLFALSCRHDRKDMTWMLQSGTGEDAKHDDDKLDGNNVADDHMELALLHRWFAHHGYVTTNPITHRKSVSLFLCLNGGHVILDNRGRTAQKCTEARLARNCRYSRSQQHVSHTCDLNCHVSGNYIRDERNDVADGNRVHAGDALRLVLTRDDLREGQHCMSIATVLQYSKRKQCILAFWANESISYAQNMATLIFILELGRLARVWGTKKSERQTPLALMTWNSYVVLGETRAPLVLSSRCAMAGSLHYNRRLRAWRSVCLKGVTQLVQVIRVHCLVIVDGLFTTVGWSNKRQRLLVYQCTEIYVTKCLPRCVGRTTQLDKDERAAPTQLCYFEQAVSAAPIGIIISGLWRMSTVLLPLQATTRYYLCVHGSLDLHSIPAALLAGAETIHHGGIDVSSSYDELGYISSRFECMKGPRSATWL